jgi:hypothetical protein
MFRRIANSWNGEGHEDRQKTMKGPVGIDASDGGTDKPTIVGRSLADPRTSAPTSCPHGAKMSRQTETSPPAGRFMVFTSFMPFLLLLFPTWLIRKSQIRTH